MEIGVGNLKKWKPYSSFHNYSPPLLLSDISFKNKKGTTPKSVFSKSQTIPKTVFKGHGKVLTDLISSDVHVYIDEIDDRWL